MSSMSKRFKSRNLKNNFPYPLMMFLGRDIKRKRKNFGQVQHSSNRVFELNKKAPKHFKNSQIIKAPRLSNLVHLSSSHHVDKYTQFKAKIVKIIV